jgi:hypothetical protein
MKKKNENNLVSIYEQKLLESLENLKKVRTSFVTPFCEGSDQEFKIDKEENVKPKSRFYIFSTLSI